MSRSSSSTPLSPSADNSDVTIGIDLGNAYCCVAHYSKSASQVIVIANEEGNRVTPSCISFTKEDTLVGEPGKEQIPRNAANTIADIKKLAGLIVSGATPEQNEQLIKTELQKQGWHFALKQQKQMIVAEVESKGETKQFTIQQLTTMLIEKVKKSAEAYLGKQVQYAVFAVPVYFTEIQRTLVKVSAEKAGLKVLTIVNEPVAAAMAYGLDTTTKQQQPQKKLALVLDIGASSCEASLLNIENGLIEIRSRVANRNLGAAEFDNRLVQLCIQEFFKKYKTDLTNNKRAVNTLKIACEKAKMALSISQTASVECDSLYDGMDFSQSITRARFEQVNNDIFNSASIQLIQHVLFHATVDKSEVTDVILCGGGNNIPKIQQLVTDYFAGTSAAIQKSIIPEEVIATGVAIEGFSLVEKIARQQQQEQVSIQVTPLTIGVETYQGLMAPVIPRNSTLPASKTVEFGVSQDGQTHLYLHVAEGERVLAKNNRQIGYVVIPLAESEQKRGTKISVTFQVNESGQLSVTSTSSQQAKLVIKQSAPSPTAPASVEELLLNAKQNRQADEKVKQEILASMGLEQLKI